MAIKGIKEVHHWDGSRFEKIKEAHEWTGTQWAQVYSSVIEFFQSGELDRGVVPRRAWTPLKTWVAPYSMTITASMIGFAWEKPGEDSSAIFRNGVRVGQEMRDGTYERTFDVDGCDVVEFSGYCSAAVTAYRNVVAGDWSVAGSIPAATSALCVTSLEDFTVNLASLNDGVPSWDGSRPKWNDWTKPNLGVELNTTAMTNMVFMFAGNKAIITVPPMDTSNVTNMSRMFYANSNLEYLPPMDCAKVTSMSNNFGACFSLTSAPLYNVGVDLGMQNTSLTPESADVLMQGLKTVPGMTLDLPTTAQGCDISIATNKGWTVTGVT